MSRLCCGLFFELPKEMVPERIFKSIIEVLMAALILILAALSPNLANADDACIGPFKNLGYHRIFLKNLEVRQITSAQRFSDASELFPESTNDLFIGFHNGGHGYFIFRQWRFDGGVASILPARITPLSNFTDGIVIRVRNLPPENAEKLAQFLSKGKVDWSFNCVTGTCNALQKHADIGFRYLGVLKTYPSFVLLSLANGGLKTNDGISLDTEFYVVGDENFTEIRRKTIFLETFSTVALSFISAVFGFFGGILIYL